MVRYGLIFSTMVVTDYSPPHELVPSIRVVRGSYPVQAAAARRTFFGRQAQIQVVVEFRCLETEIVKIAGAVDGRYVDERNQVTVGINQPRNHHLPSSSMSGLSVLSAGTAAHD